MANFNLVVNTSNFKPFTYEEMVRPLLLYKQEEEARQKAYLDLQEKASTLEDLAASEKDAEAYGAYTAYKNRLREVADAMAKNGLTRQNNQVFNLRKSYINDIKPLNDLLEKRNKLVEEQRANNKDGTNIYSIDYGDMPLAEMKKNPTQTYNTLNGNVIRAMSAEIFAPLAKQILESPEYTSISGKVGKQYFQERIQRGYTLDQMINELQGTEAGSKLAQVKQNILSSLGMDKKGFSTAKQAQVEQFVNMGAMAALGETEYGNLNDKSYLDPLQKVQKSASEYALTQSQAEDKFKYIYDDNKNIKGFNPKYIEATKTTKVDNTPTIKIGENNYTVITRAGSKVVIKINSDGSRSIIDANDPIAKSVRKSVTGSESIKTSSEDDDWNYNEESNEDKTSDDSKVTAFS